VGERYCRFVEAVAGVVVGFVLKALFDILTESQRRKREDRLRFIEQKMSSYADFASIAVRSRSLAAQAHDVIQELTELGETTAALVVRYEREDVESHEELDSLRTQFATLGSILGRIEGRQEAQEGELHRSLGVTLVLAPDNVREAAQALAMTLAGPDAKGDFDTAYSRFREAAAKDLGR